jgi:DNA-binding transcriptional ArsR family regulator
LREVADVRTLRALAHPVRIALLETLLVQGPLTATEAGEHIGESPTTCSFHLRQLAKYGFVEEAGGGTGRARPWRMTSIGLRIGSGHGDAEADLAAEVLARLLRQRQLGRYRSWLETRGAFPKVWRDAASQSEYVFFITAAELQRLNEELTAMLESRWRERATDASRRPPGSVPVELLMFAYPMARPPAD